MAYTLEFKKSGRGKAQCPPDPNYPNGIALDATERGRSKDTCLVTLPYPAAECGAWIVRCSDCAMSVAVTAAGRPDDPISVRMSCKKKAHEASA